MGKPECSTVLHNRWGIIQHGVQQRSNDVLHQLVTMKQGVNVWPQSGFRNGSFFMTSMSVQLSIMFVCTKSQAIKIRLILS